MMISSPGCYSYHSQAYYCRKSVLTWELPREYKGRALVSRAWTSFHCLTRVAYEVLELLKDHKSGTHFSSPSLINHLQSGTISAALSADLKSGRFRTGESLERLWRDMSNILMEHSLKSAHFAETEPQRSVLPWHLLWTQEDYQLTSPISQ
jgi:hypothetical protein